MPQEDWGLVVDPVVHTINKCVLNIHGFSPAELLLGYNPRSTGGGTSPDMEHVVVAKSPSMG